VTDLAHVPAAADAAAGTTRQDPGLNVVVSTARTRIPAWPITTWKRSGQDRGTGDTPTGMPAWADDFDGLRAEQYRYVNRVIADDELDEEVSRIAVMSSAT
jgi:hypothetical protein